MQKRFIGLSEYECSASQLLQFMHTKTQMTCVSAVCTHVQLHAHTIFKLSSEPELPLKRYNAVGKTHFR